MTKFNVLYNKPKSFLREVTQKLFLKFLLKLFPKKFLDYKNKIKTILNTKVNYLFFLLLSIYLKFKYPLYFSLPSRHLYSIHIIIKFLKILKKQKIDFFLIGGSLLGAVRQESFAGSPQDIDLGIKEDHFSKLLDATPLLKKKSGATAIRRQTCDKLEKLQILFRYTLVDVSVFSKRNGMWIGEPEKDQKLNYTTFPIEDLEHLVAINVYGKQFLAPGNPEIYLKKVFGENWRTPDKKQFFWNKNKSK